VPQKHRRNGLERGGKIFFCALHPQKFLPKTLDQLLIFFGFETADAVNENSAGSQQPNRRARGSRYLPLRHSRGAVSQLGEQRAMPSIFP